MAVSVFTGTVDLVNNSPTIVVSGFTLSPLGIFPGSQVSIDGEAYFLESVTNTTTAELTRPYTGSTASGLPLEINVISENETEIVTLNIRTAQLIEDLLAFDPLGNLSSISALTGNGVIMQDATGAHSLVPRSSLTAGVDVDARVETLPERATYDAQPKDFAVYVNNVGTAFGPENDGRAAVFFKLTNTIADWSTPAYQTGANGQTGAAGPYTEITVGPTTTLAPGSSATVTPVVVDPDTIRLDFGLPSGADGTGSGIVQSIVPGTNITIDDTDPANPIISSTGGGGGSASVVDRAALAALPTTNGDAYLSESNVFGWFKWSAANMSASVAIDTAAAVFVPPTSDTSGASGAWVRQFTGAVQGKWYGNNLQAACNVAFLLSRDLFLGLKGDTYTITSGITIPNILVYSNLLGGSGAKIVASNAAYTAVTMGAGARFIGIEVEGPGNATYNALSFGVVATGTNNAPAAPTYADKITIQNCYIHHFGNACIEVRYVSNGSVTHNLVTNAGYAGIANISVLDCDFFQNRIKDIGPGESANAYGIFVSRNNGSYTAFPQSQRVTIRHCVVSGMALWHAFDTHGGIDVTFSDCISIDSPRGFIITSTGDVTNGFRAPIRCKIIGCKAFGKATRALRDQGFWVVGAWNGSVYAQYAENCEIVDSYFFQHGTDTTEARRACGFLGGTRNLVIRNLTIDQASGHGIQFEIENVDYSINGLNLIDWNSNFSSSIGLLYSGNGNRGRIVDFKLLRNNTGLATNVSSIGFYSGAGLTGFQLSTIAPRNLAVTATSYGTTPTNYDI